MKYHQLIVKSSFHYTWQEIVKHQIMQAMQGLT